MKALCVPRASAIAALLAIGLLMPPSVSAQNVAITNVRIVVGSGQVDFARVGFALVALG